MGAFLQPAEAFWSAVMCLRWVSLRRWRDVEAISGGRLRSDAGVNLRTLEYPLFDPVHAGGSPGTGGWVCSGLGQGRTTPLS